MIDQLPPPSGRPATLNPRSDPWEEQRRRDHEHRAGRSRRRRRWLIPLSILLLLGLAGGAAFLLFPRTERSDAELLAPTAAPTTAEFVEPPAPTVPPERLVEVGEVWLLDRGDGVYDWGLSVFVPQTGPTRSGVEVSVTLLDDDNDVVDTIERVLTGVNSLVPSTAAGRLVDPERPPTRLEFDITVGVPSDDLALDALLGTRAVRRDGDELTGRIRSSALTDVDDVTMVMVWRSDGSERADDDEPNIDIGDVVAVVTYEIARIRPGVDAQFAIDLDEQRAPDGAPDAVLWSPAT